MKHALTAALAAATLAPILAGCGSSATTSTPTAGGTATIESVQACIKGDAPTKDVAWGPSTSGTIDGVDVTVWKTPGDDAARAIFTANNVGFDASGTTDKRWNQSDPFVWRWAAAPTAKMTLDLRECLGL